MGHDDMRRGNLVAKNRLITRTPLPNELFLEVAASLANRTAGKESAFYLAWADKEWAWFKGSGMINSENLINDGLNSTNPNACRNNGQTTWTYNQGVILEDWWNSREQTMIRHCWRWVRQLPRLRCPS